MDDPIETFLAARLYGVARALTGALTAVEVAGAVFEHALAGLGASSAGLWLVETGVIRFVGGVGVTQRMPAHVATMPLTADTPAGLCVSTAAPVTYGSVVERDRRWPRLAGLPTPSEATAVLPLIVHERTIGCLHIGYPMEMTAVDFDMPFLLRLAELCAAGMDRARLHDHENDRHQFLLRASSAVAAGAGFVDTLRRLAEVAVPDLADLCLIDIAGPQGRIERVAGVHADPGAAALVAELCERYPPDPGGRHPSAESMRTRRSIWAAEMADGYLDATTQDPRHREIVGLLGFSSYMSVPLISGGEVLGAVTFVSAGSGRRFGAADLALAEELATQVAGVSATARRHDREREVAHVLQQLLLPGALPDIDGLSSEGRYLTAEAGSEAGGDFYDVVRLPSGRAGFVIGDVEGHDAAAAATMGQLRCAIRALAGQYREPSLLLDGLRWSWDLLGLSRMATAMFGRLDPVTGEAVMTSAGHLPPLVVRSGGGAEVVVMDRTPPLGVDGRPAADTRVTLRPGDTLVLFTDGLIDGRPERPTRSVDGALSELCRAAASGGGTGLAELCDELLASQSRGSGRPDDVALLAIRMDTSPAVD